MTIAVLWVAAMVSQLGSMGLAMAFEEDKKPVYFWVSVALSLIALSATYVAGVNS